MKKSFQILAGLCLLFLAAIARAEEDEAWAYMPAGARPSYMGIHGGTMPVSLLVSRDGSSLFTFVGRTGNDFIEALRGAQMPLPSIGNSTSFSLARSRPKTGLFAGNATASMPVIALPGETVAQIGLAQHLLPFGLSAEPISIEGQTLKPDVSPLARPYRLLFMPDYLRPRRGAR